MLRCLASSTLLVACTPSFVAPESCWGPKSLQPMDCPDYVAWDTRIDAGSSDMDTEILDVGGDSGLAEDLTPAVAIFPPQPVTPTSVKWMEVSWTSQGASDCYFSATIPSNATMPDSAHSATGAMSIYVNTFKYADLSCFPEGPAARARMALAPPCQGTLTTGSLLVGLNGAVDIIAGEVDLGAKCALVQGDIETQQGAQPEALAQILEVTGHVRLFYGPVNGLDFVQLRHAGMLSVDYLGDTEEEELRFPSLESLDVPTVILHNDRAAFPKLQRWHPQIIGGRFNVLQVLSGVTLAGFTLQGSQNTVAPLILGQISGVDGNFTVRENPLLPHAEALKLQALMGTVHGAISICGNLDDAPCPP